MRISVRLSLAAALAAVLAVASASTAPPGASTAPAIRPHDQRHFTVDEAALPFEALEAPAVSTDRWWGVEKGAGYRVEVPANWNGRLVMYAHGYRGAGEELTPSLPHFRLPARSSLLSLFSFPPSFIIGSDLFFTASQRRRSRRGR